MMLVDLLSWLVLGGIRSEATGEVDHEVFDFRVVLGRQLFLCELVFWQRWPQTLNGWIFPKYV